MKEFQVARSAQEGTHFKIDGDEFVARPADDLPGGVILDLGTAMNGNAAEQSMALFSFLRLALEPDSLDLLEKRLRDPRNPIPIPMIGEVANWLMEEVYGGRPTKPSVPSANGRSGTGRRSTAGAPRKASTRSTSPSGGS